LFFIFHCCCCCCCCYSHLFTNDDGIPPRLYTASKKTDSMPASRFDYSWTEKERKKKCGNGMLPMLTLLVCLFIYSAYTDRSAVYTM
jgi:hypothetical protein